MAAIFEKKVVEPNIKYVSKLFIWSCCEIEVFAGKRRSSTISKNHRDTVNTS
jgi:hypothetical protein